MERDEIAGFFLAGWYVFDSYSPFQIEWRGKLWPTAEHAYQAAHFFDTKPELAKKIRLLKSPVEADKFANEHEKYEDPDWKEKRIAIMTEITRAKYEQHPIIQETLLKTGKMPIIEMSEDDSFWGWGSDRKGQNMLGNIWMKLREEVIGSSANL